MDLAPARSREAPLCALLDEMGLSRSTRGYEYLLTAAALFRTGCPVGPPFWPGPPPSTGSATALWSTPSSAPKNTWPPLPPGSASPSPAARSSFPSCGAFFWPLRPYLPLDSTRFW